MNFLSFCCRVPLWEPVTPRSGDLLLLWVPLSSKKKVLDSPRLILLLLSILPGAGSSNSLSLPQIYSLPERFKTYENSPEPCCLLQLLISLPKKSEVPSTRKAVTYNPENQSQPHLKCSVSLSGDQPLNFVTDNPETDYEDPPEYAAVALKHTAGTLQTPISHCSVQPQLYPSTRQLEENVKTQWFYG